MKRMKMLIMSFLAAASVGTSAQGSGPTDAQIAGIVVTANQVDIDAGKLAQSNATSKDVKAFAQQMVIDHAAVNTSATELVTRLKVKPEPSATSKSLQQAGDDNIAKLKKRRGADFDRAYVDHEVVYHQAVLDELDKTLVPTARNAELKALLEKTRPAFAAHLEHAKQIQARLGKSGG